MSEWHKTGCVLCAQNCGLEVRVENNRMVKVRPDKDNPRSQGYACRKGLNVAFHQHHDERLKHPLKRVGDRFEPISWDQAVEEIAEKLQAIVSRHGPRVLAYMGGGGQGCHFEAAFGVRLLRGLGSHYHYNALGQELTGSYWVWGRLLGRQYLLVGADHHRSDMLVAWGWNGMMSHQMPQARRFLTRLSQGPRQAAGGDRSPALRNGPHRRHPPARAAGHRRPAGARHDRPHPEGGLARPGLARAARERF